MPVSNPVCQHNHLVIMIHDACQGPLADFFAQYTNFDYKPAKSASAEFYRLNDSNGWGKDSEEWKEAKRGFQDALTMQFNINYGTDVNDLTRWQALCAKLQMDPVPENLKDCREVRGTAYVNQPVNFELMHLGYRSCRPSEASTLISWTWWITSTLGKKSAYSLLWSL
jgi:hypothetical protein